MDGMNAKTGETLSGLDHLRQSILIILTTPIGSRVYRRDFGSALFELLDNPTNDAWAVDVYAAIAEALAKWEPRLRLKKVSATRVKNGTGKILIDISGELLVDGQAVYLDGIEVS